MKKLLLSFQLVCFTGIISLSAQSLYPINKDWVDLETLTKSDKAPDNADSVNFKKVSKFANRFNVVALLGDVPKETVYKGRPFRIVDEGHLGFHIPPATKDVLIECNKDENKLDPVAGNDFLVTVPDGIIHVQRFEGKTGYFISRLDEWGKPRFRQNLQHTVFTPVKGADDFKTPYLFYFTHTDRFMAFTSLNTHSIHKTVIMDLKDGKTLPIESTICGVIRADNEVAFKGYLIRDEASKAMKVSMPGANWTLGDKNITKLLAETINTDTLLVMARYHQGTPGISLIAFNATTGKAVWNGEVKQSAAGVNGIYLSMYNNKLMMEVAQAGTDNTLQVFDMANGKRLYTTIQ